jgi:acyl-coenzyme A synthetase/AMP-(fatty) acid ligase
MRCLAEVEPEGFVAIPIAQWIRRIFRRRFPRARLNVTVGRRLLGGGLTLDDVRRIGSKAARCHATSADDPAAIIFTSGGTGAPKGVLYCHGNFDRQVSEIRDFYGIRPGEIDLAAFPLFGLFNGAMGVTTVVPDMDASRPARVDPRNIVEAVRDWQVTQSFGSPAIWNRVGEYCQRQNIALPSLRRVLSAGAPVPPHVLARMKGCIANDGEVHTPYGATESLPVASISAGEVLAETKQAWAEGAGTCVGGKFPGIAWKVIQITDGPIATLSDAVESPNGEIGELLVSGPVVTREYVTRSEWNALAKIADGPRVWHRLGDVGYLDERGRFWFCGRMAHRLQTADGTMYTICCEAIFNQHPDVYRSALVGVGAAGQQRPVIVVESWPQRRPRGARARQKLVDELRTLGERNPLTAGIHDFLIHPAMPVDVRHNAKIAREKLARWASGKLR